MKKNILMKSLAVVMALEFLVSTNIPVYAEDVQSNNEILTESGVSTLDTDSEDIVQDTSSETGKENGENISSENPDNKVEVPANETETSDVSSDNSVEGNEKSASGLEGEGTVDAPYQVGSAEDLKLVAEKVNAGEVAYGKAYYKLTANIDLSGSEDNQWTPIGTTAHRFEGTFTGTGYTISNLYINNSELEYAGLFGCINTPAKLSGITVNNAIVTGKSNVGVIAGSAYTGTVENCKVTGKITVSGNYKVGGMFGEGYANISGCSVQVNAGSTVTGVYLATDLEGDNVGGLIGYRGEGSGINTINCSVSGVTVAGTRKVGGLVGSAFTNNKYEGCSASGVTVVCNATDSYGSSFWNKSAMAIGGLIGLYTANGSDDGTLKNCSVSDITLQVTDETLASKNTVVMGYVSGGQRSNKAPASTITVENITVSGTNTGSNAETKYPGSVAVNGEQQIFSSGSGTAEDPYVICTVDELKLFANTVNSTGISYEGQYLKLSDEITELDISGEKWTSIGTSSNKFFMGTFDGNDKIVKGLTDNGKSGTYGLFGYISGATIKNLKLTDVNLEYKSGTKGALVSHLYGSNTIDNIEVSGTVNGGDYTGGIVGRPHLSTDVDILTISNCTNNATVTGTDKNGGIIGYARADKGKIILEKCKNTGSVTGKYAGGVAGFAWNTTFSGCSNTGEVKGTEIAGGIVGNANAGTTIGLSINSGNVTCDKAAGGILGSSASGGNIISASANTGNVTGAGNAGGIIGGSTASGDYIDNCYNEGTITATGENSIAGGIYGYNNNSCGVKACVNDGSITAEQGTAYQIGKSGYWYDQATGSKNESCYYLDKDGTIYLASGNGDEAPTRQDGMTRTELSDTLTTAGGIENFWRSQNQSVQPQPLIPGSFDDETLLVATVLDENGKLKEGYTSVEDAMAAAENGETVQLSKNVTLTGVLAVTGDKSVTLDLAGHVLEGAEDSVVIEIGNKGTGKDTSVLTLTDSSDSNAGKVISKANKAAVCVREGAGMVTKKVSLEFADTNNSAINSMIQVQGELTVETGTVITSTEAGITVLGDGAKLTINDGAKIEGASYAISGNGNYSGTEIIINGGEITSEEGAGIYHPQAGTLTLNGGSITGLTGVQICAGELVVPENSKVIVTGTGDDKREDSTNGDGTIVDGAAVSIVNRNYPGGVPKAIIKGGSFKSEKSEAVLDYTWADKATSEWTDAGDFIEISGGIFNTAVPDNLCAESFAPNQDANGNYTVHQHKFVWVIDKEATAAEAGSKHEECKVCGYEKEAVKIPAIGQGNKPDKQNKTANKNASVQTGDNTRMPVVPLLTLLFSGAVLIVIFARRRSTK